MEGLRSLEVTWWRTPPWHLSQSPQAEERKYGKIPAPSDAHPDSTSSWQDSVAGCQLCRLSAFQDPHVPQPLQAWGHLHGHRGWAAAVCSLALISTAPPGWHGPGLLTGLLCSWLEAQNLSAASLRCCPIAALVQDFRVLSTHPAFSRSFSHPGHRPQHLRTQGRWWACSLVGRGPAEPRWGQPSGEPGQANLKKGSLLKFTG